MRGENLNSLLQHFKSNWVGLTEHIVDYLRREHFSDKFRVSVGIALKHLAKLLVVDVLLRLELELLRYLLV